MERLLKDAQEISGVEYDIENLGDVYDAIHVIQGELGLTGVAANEAKTTLTGSMGAVKASWENTMAALATGEGLDTAMANLTQSVGNFATNVLGMLSNLGPELPPLILGLADIILDNLPAFVQTGVEIVAKLIIGLVQSIPDIIKTIPQLIKAIMDGFATVDWSSLGKQVVDGIIHGLTAGATRLWNKMKELVRGAETAAQDEAMIGSPSRLFANEVGRWIPPGIAVGAEENMAPLNRTMASIADTTLADMQRAVNLPTQSAAQGSSLERSIASLASRPVNVGVVLDANARKLLRVVRTENYSETRRTSYNGLAAMA